MSESTNRLSIDADQLVPRVIKQGTLTSTAAAGSGDFFDADISVTVDDLDQSVNSWIEAWVEIGGSLYEMPTSTVHASSGQVDISTGIGIYRSPNSIGGYSTLIQFSIIRNSNYGSTSDTYTVHYTVYSTKVTEERLV